MKVIKRDGSVAPYQTEKISIAISGAFNELGKEFFDDAVIADVENIIYETYNDVVGIEDIQDIVEDVLIEHGYITEAKAYIRYRYKKELLRKANTTDKSIKELLNGESEFWNKENSNKNAKWVTTQRDYIAGITSKDIARRFIFPQDVIEAHDSGAIHIHDMDYAAQNTLHNCCLINLNDMLQNGTVVNGITIDKPHRLSTAMTIATQIIAAVASSQYGGTTINLAHLAPFVRDSWNRHYKDAIEETKDLVGELWQYQLDTLQTKIADSRTKKEIQDAVQTLNYQLNSLTTTNGQSPFVSVFMYLGDTEEYKEELAMLIEEVLNQRIQGMKNKQGVYVTVAFPKLLYVLEEDNIHEDSPYWYLTELAAKCTAKRMVPDYISEKKMKELKLSLGEQPGQGDVYGCMGCRSFLTPDRSGNGYNNMAHALDYNGKPKYWGRFNIGVSTVNLVDAALAANKKCMEHNYVMADNDSEGNAKYNQEAMECWFWPILNEYTELCHKAQRIRAERLSGTKAEVAPILWCDGALARLNPEDTLYNLIHNGYCTSSLGYAGLYECVKVITGESHTSQKGKEFGLRVMQYLNDKCAKWKEEENIDYSLYGTPIESTTYKFAQSLQKKYGVVPGITDRDYITNSYHVPVFEEINAFDKLAKEAEFQVLSPGGAISYIETPNLQNNIPAILAVMNFIYEHIMYAELNTKSDYCQVCGYDGEILIKEENPHKHYFECPNCGNTNEEKMNIARRVCGYIGTNGYNEGRLQDIANRICHLDDKEFNVR